MVNQSCESTNECEFIFIISRKAKKDLVQMTYQHIITIRLQAERKKQ